MFNPFLKCLLILSSSLLNISSGNITRPIDREIIVSPAESTPILWTLDASPDGKYYAVGGNDGSLRVFNSATHSIRQTYNLKHAVQCLDWNENGRELAIALDAASARVLNLETGHFRELKQVTGSRALDWNADGSLLAVGDYDNSLLVFDSELKLISSIKTKDNKTHLSVEWHPGKNIILTGTDRIRIFDLTGKLLQDVKHRTEETPILAVRWHPSGTFFATGDYGEPENNIESLLQFWSEDGKLIKTLHGSKAEYRNIRWNKKGNVLATASDALRLWSEDGEVLSTGKSADLLWGIDWSSNSSNVITGNRSGKINLWSKKARLLKVY